MNMNIQYFVYILTVYYLSFICIVFIQIVIEVNVL